MGAKIPGVEGAHEWNGSGLVLSQNIGLPFPRYWLRRIGGWRTKPDLEVESDKPWGRSGEIPRQSFSDSKTVVYVGDTEARSLGDVRSAESDLIAAFEGDAVGKMVVTPPAGGGLTGVSFTGTPISGGGDDEEWAASVHAAHGGYARPFLVAVRMHDPHFYELVEQSALTGALTAGTGLTYPIAYPVEYPELGATFGNVAVTNPGARADPVIDLHGPSRNPRIYNDTLAAVLSFPGLRIPVGEYLRIDFARRQVLLNGIADYARYLDLPASSWWYAGVPGLLRGLNQLRYRGDEMSAPAYAEVRYFPRHR